MGKPLLIASLIANLILIVILAGFIQTFGGPKYFWFRLTNSGVTGESEGRNEHFNDLAVPRNAIVMLGDSLTHHGEWHELLDNPRVVNRGIFGQWSEVLYSRLDYLAPLQPEKVFIMTGINDLRGRTPPEIAETHAKIVQRIEQETPAALVFVQSVLPVNNDIQNTGRTNEDIVVLNTHLASVCEQQACTYIDLHSQFVDTENRLHERFTHDGVHMSGDGYRLWAQLIEPYVMQAPAAKTTSF